MLLDCFYRGEKCGFKDFKTVFTRYGKCYSFNHPDNESEIRKTLKVTSKYLNKSGNKVFKGGVDNGLELLLDVQQDEYMPMWKESGLSPLNLRLESQLY